MNNCIAQNGQVSAPSLIGRLLYDCERPQWTRYVASGSLALVAHVARAETAGCADGDRRTDTVIA